MKALELKRLTREQQTQIVTLFVNGNGIRQIGRITKISDNAVKATLLRVGLACRWFFDGFVRNLSTADIQLDEQWQFIYAKDKTVPIVKRPQRVMGSVWLWLAVCRRSRLIISWDIGKRDYEAAQVFLNDVAARINIKQRLTITTDLHAPYGPAIENAFPHGVDYTRTRAPKDDESLAGVLIRKLGGEPEVRKGGTNHVERVNGTIRHFNPNHKRSAYTFAKNIENYEAYMAIQIVHYDFCWVPRTLRVTPAMEIGLTDRIWGAEDLVDLPEQYELYQKKKL